MTRLREASFATSDTLSGCRMGTEACQTTPKPVLKYPGAKWSTAPWICGFFTPHRVYLEPYFGSGATFFTKRPSKVEIINDLDGRVVNLFRVIREHPEELAAALEMTPWARDEYAASDGISGDPVEDARRFLVRCHQAVATKVNARTGWRRDRGSSSNTTRVVQWRNLPGRVLAAADRLKDAYVDNRPALDLIREYRAPDVLVYCDPPYVRSTRSDTYYAHEMSDEDHEELLETLLAHPGPVLLSGYACDLYDATLLKEGWLRETRTARAEKGRVRMEVLWGNPVTLSALEGRLFWQP
jgi:DNA adenine methylase